MDLGRHKNYLKMVTSVIEWGQIKESGLNANRAHSHRDVIFFVITVYLLFFICLVFWFLVLYVALLHYLITVLINPDVWLVQVLCSCMEGVGLIWSSISSLDCVSRSHNASISSMTYSIFGSNLLQIQFLRTLNDWPLDYLFWWRLFVK